MPVPLRHVVPEQRELQTDSLQNGKSRRGHCTGQSKVKGKKNSTANSQTTKKSLYPQTELCLRVYRSDPPLFKVRWGNFDDLSYDF